MWPPVNLAENLFYNVSGKPSGKGGKKLVALDASSDAVGSVVRLDSQDAGLAANVHVASERDLLREGKDKFNGAARFDDGLDHEIKAAETHVTRFATFFDNSGIRRKADLKRQHHRKSPRGATLHGRFH